MDILDIHVVGVIGLLLIFAVGTTRPVSLGALALVATFLLGSLVAGEPLEEMYLGFPIDLFVLLAGVTYLFGIATSNGTVEWIVDWASRGIGGRRALVPWLVFVMALLPTAAGALGPATVAMLAPICLRLATRYRLSERMVGLLTIHGSAAGNFSPVNPLGAIVTGSVERADLSMSVPALFFANLAYNCVLGAAIVLVYRRISDRAEPVPVGAAEVTDRSGAVTTAATAGSTAGSTKPARPALTIDKAATLLVIVVVAVCAMVFDLDLGFLALSAAVLLHLVFPRTSARADQRIAWGVVLLICGVVTYVAALQRYGTVDLVGDRIAGLNAPLLAAFLLCLIAAVTSAAASSAGLLVALIPLAVPLLDQGHLSTTAMIVALALSATVVDASPFSTVGALVVANTPEDRRPWVYRGLLAWGGVMVLTAPVACWLLFILPFG